MEETDIETWKKKQAKGGFFAWCKKWVELLLVW